MRIVGIKDLKNQLSEYVKAAAAGETVLVTDRNRVVAELVPPASGRSAAPGDALLADAVRQGWITPPPLVASGAPPRRPIAPLDDILTELREDRDAR
jgi:prevent-host-death family protein